MSCLNLRRYRSAIPVLILFILGACSSNTKMIESDIDHSYHCQEILSFGNPDTLTSEELSADSFMIQEYEYVELEIANAYGFFDELKEFETLKERIDTNLQSRDQIVEILKVAQRINQGLSLASMEVESVTDLVDCNINQLRKFESLVIKENIRRQTNLSNWAIVTGGATTVVTAGVLLSNDDDLIGSSFFDWLAVAGGIATTYLAIKSSKVSNEIRLDPVQNFIEVIWTGENINELIPPSTWHLMNVEFEDEGELTSIRKIILDEWNNSTRLFGNEENLQYLPVLLSHDGVYDADLIEMRIEMMESIAEGCDEIDRALYLFSAKRHF